MSTALQMGVADMIGKPSAQKCSGGKVLGEEL
jgi:hypothetical protein